MDLRLTPQATCCRPLRGLAISPFRGPESRPP